MKPTIISDTLHRIIVVQAEVQDQAMNATHARLIEQGEADKWEVHDCSLQVHQWPTRRYRVEFRPVDEQKQVETAVYPERAERWQPA